MIIAQLYILQRFWWKYRLTLCKGDNLAIACLLCSLILILNIWGDVFPKLVIICFTSILPMLNISVKDSLHMKHLSEFIDSQHVTFLTSNILVFWVQIKSVPVVLNVTSCWHLYRFIACYLWTYLHGSLAPKILNIHSLWIYEEI